MPQDAITPNQFFPTLELNIDNEKMSDADFRQFVRNSTKGMKAQPSMTLHAIGHTVTVEAPAEALTWLKVCITKSENLDNLVRDTLHLDAERSRAKG